MNIKFKQFCKSYGVPFYESGMAVYMGIESSKRTDSSEYGLMITHLKTIQSIIQPKIKRYLKSKYYRIWFKFFYADFDYYRTLNQLINEFIAAYENPTDNEKYLNL